MSIDFRIKLMATAGQFDPIPELRELLTGAVRLGAALLSCAALAYPIGWVALNAYLSKFGAAWLVTEVPFQLILSHSVMPLFALLVSLWTELRAFDEYFPRSGPKIVVPKRSWWVDGPLIPIGVMLLLLYYAWQKLGPALFGTIPYLVSGWSAITIAIILRRLRQKTFGWNWASAKSMVIMSIFAFFLLPYSFGVLRGYGDSGAKSSLPIVYLKTANSKDVKWQPRLLFYANDKFYVTYLGQLENGSRVSVLDLGEVDWIQQVVTKKAKQPHSPVVPSLPSEENRRKIGTEK